KLDRGEGRIDWRAEAAEIDRRVRALNPWPGTWFALGDDRIRVLAGEALPATAAGGAAAGTVLDDRLAIACGAGAYRPTRVQRAGRAPVETAAMLRGFPVAPGTRLPLP